MSRNPVGDRKHGTVLDEQKSFPTTELDQQTILSQVSGQGRF